MELGGKRGKEAPNYSAERSERPATEQELTNEVAQRLEGNKWAVERETIFGPMRVDIFAKDPDNSRAYAIEVKLGKDKDTHFSAIAEIKNAASSAEQGSGVEKVIPVIVTDYDVSPAVQQVADKIGVDIVKVLDSLSSASDHVLNRIFGDVAEDQ